MPHYQARGSASPNAFIGFCESTQFLISQWNRLVVIDSILCRKNKRGQPRVVVPDSKRITVLKLYHLLPGALHEGVGKMTQRISQKFYWFNLHRDVALFVFDCDLCKTLKMGARKTKEELEPLPVGYANQRVHVDFAGPVATTANGHKFIFVVVDAFSGYVSATPTRDTSAVSAMNALLCDWVAQFGLPAWIHSD